MSVWLPLLSACNLRVVLGDWQGSKCKCECFAAFSLRTKSLTIGLFHISKKMPKLLEQYE